MILLEDFGQIFAKIFVLERKEKILNKITLNQ
jgi:hypothetical protein